MIIICYLLLLVNLSIGIFLLRRFLSQRKKNPTTLFWVIAFVLAALTESLINPRLGFPFSFSFILFDWSMLLLFLGVLLYLTSRRTLIYGMVIIIALGSVIFHLWALKTGLSLKIETGLGASLLTVPIALFLSLIFAIVYAVLSFAREKFKNHLGPLILSIGFALEGVLLILSPLIFETQFFPYWYLLRVVNRSLIFLGIYLLDRETHKLIDLKRRIHGLYEPPE